MDQNRFMDSEAMNHNGFMDSEAMNQVGSWPPGLWTRMLWPAGGGGRRGARL